MGFVRFRHTLALCSIAAAFAAPVASAWSINGGGERGHTWNTNEDYFAFTGGGKITGISLTKSSTATYGARLMGGSETPDMTFRMNIEFMLGHSLTQADTAKLEGRLAASIIHHDKHVFVDWTLAEATPSRIGYFNVRAGPSFGTQTLNVSLYGGFRPAKENATDTLALSLTGGAQLAARVKNWLRIRAALEGGATFNGGRDKATLAADDPLNRGKDLLPSTPVAGGNLFRTELEADARIGESPAWVSLRALATRMELKERDVPEEGAAPDSTPVRTLTNTEVGVAVTAGFAF